MHQEQIPEPTKHGERLLALRRIIDICDTATWSHATKIRRIKAAAQTAILGRRSELPPEEEDGHA
jgi:hypothetical protein